jgi:peptide deformylase
MKRSVVLYPHNSLKRKAKPVTLDYIQSDEFRFRISDMFRVMYYGGGVGLAAPQVDWDARLFILNPTGRDEHSSKSMVVINPEIIPIEGEETKEEGCLSLPGLWLPVKRYNKIKVRALNENGHSYEVCVDGFLSRIIQHEYDHLNGIMMMDRAETTKVEPGALREFNLGLESQEKRIKKLRRLRAIAQKKRDEEKRRKRKARVKSKKRKRNKRKKGK